MLGFSKLAERNIFAGKSLSVEHPLLLPETKLPVMILSFGFSDYDEKINVSFRLALHAISDHHQKKKEKKGHKLWRIIIRKKKCKNGLIPRREYGFESCSGLFRNQSGVGKSERC